MVLPPVSERLAASRPAAASRPVAARQADAAAEAEFMQAMREYKDRSGRMFPTWSEVLEVLRSLGYEKPSA